MPPIGSSTNQRNDIAISRRDLSVRAGAGTGMRPDEWWEAILIVTSCSKPMRGDQHDERCLLNPCALNLVVCRHA